MINLKKLKVSLTKNGYHKIWELIKKLPINTVLENTDGGVKDIHINLAQARWILSGNVQNQLPIAWHEVKKLGDDSIKNLVFIAIIYSHHELINELINSKNTKYEGILKRNGGLGEKAYTNLVFTMTEFGFITEAQYHQVSYDLSKIFLDQNLGPLAKRIIEAKLIKAGWDTKEDFFDVCKNLSLNKVLAIDRNSFRSWLEGNGIPGITETIVEIIDDDLDQKTNVELNFRPGNNLEKTAYEQKRKATKKIVDRQHVRIQKAIFQDLCIKHGQDNVATELGSGFGTPIDIVLNLKGEYVFYEVKTDDTVKRCIRGALSQLLEYSYWGNEKGKAKQLIIVSTLKTNSNAKNYLKLLRDKCNIPVYYQRFNVLEKKLEKLE